VALGAVREGMKWASNTHAEHNYYVDNCPYVGAIYGHRKRGYTLSDRRDWERDLLGVERIWGRESLTTETVKRIYAKLAKHTEPEGILDLLAQLQKRFGVEPDPKLYKLGNLPTTKDDDLQIQGLIDLSIQRVRDHLTKPKTTEKDALMREEAKRAASPEKKPRMVYIESLKKIAEAKSKSERDTSQMICEAQRKLFLKTKEIPPGDLRDIYFRLARTGLRKGTEVMEANLEYLKRFTGTFKPDQHFADSVYRSLLRDYSNRRSTDDLLTDFSIVHDQILERLAVELSDEQRRPLTATMQEAYASLILDHRAEDINTLRKMMGKQSPILDKEVAKKAYNAVVSAYATAESVGELKPLTSEEVTYNLPLSDKEKLIFGLLIEQFSSLEEITGVSPDIEELNKAYEFGDFAAFYIRTSKPRALFPKVLETSGLLPPRGIINPWDEVKFFDHWEQKLFKVENYGGLNLLRIGAPFLERRISEEYESHHGWNPM
jgi:hypothetical protein